MNNIKKYFTFLFIFLCLYFLSPLQAQDFVQAQKHTQNETGPIRKCDTLYEFDITSWLDYLYKKIFVRTNSTCLNIYESEEKQLLKREQPTIYIKKQLQEKKKL